MHNNNQSFAQIGEIFNDATNRLEGGIGPQNQQAVLGDIAKVQAGLQGLLQNNPGEFNAVSTIHVQNIIDQLNLEKQAIASVGTDPFAAKYINDVQRDLIDIVQGDDALAALATQGHHNGFAAVPSLLVGPAPFPGNAEQTAFMQSFVTQTQDFAGRAVALAGQGAAADPNAIKALVGEVQAAGAHDNAFTVAQGGLYSARFNNEFAADGVNGTASRALVDGLQTGNANEVNAAAQVLLANSADVAGNMLGLGQTPPPSPGTGIPDHVDNLALAGTIFNDATAKLIGGVYDGNRQSIHNDLAATVQGFQSVLGAHELTGRAAADASHIVDLLGRELAIVDNVNAGPNAAAAIHGLQASVVSIVQHDTVLATMASADGATGFMALPPQSGGNGNGGGNGPIPHAPDPHGPAPHGPAPHAPDSHAAVAQADPLAHIFASIAHHPIG